MPPPRPSGSARTIKEHQRHRHQKGHQKGAIKRGHPHFEIIKSIKRGHPHFEIRFQRIGVEYRRFASATQAHVVRYVDMAAWIVSTPWSSESAKPAAETDRSGRDCRARVASMYRAHTPHIANRCVKPPVRVQQDWVSPFAPSPFCPQQDWVSPFALPLLSRLGVPFCLLHPLLHPFVPWCQMWVSPFDRNVGVPFCGASPFVVPPLLCRR